MVSDSPTRHHISCPSRFTNQENRSLRTIPQDMKTRTRTSTPSCVIEEYLKKEKQVEKKEEEKEEEEDREREQIVCGSHI